MQYPHIVALIDARIAHLQEMRDALAVIPEHLEASPRRRKPRKPPAARVPKQRVLKPRVEKEKELVASAPEVVPELVAAPEPLRLPFVAPRNRPAARKKAPPPEKLSALAGALPAGPVVVSAARVREEAQRRILEEKPALLAQDAPADPDQILKRWRQAQNA